MNFKKEISFEIEKNNRNYRLVVEEGSPLGDTYQATWDILEYLAKSIQENVENSKAKEPEKDEMKEESSP